MKKIALLIANQQFPSPSEKNKYFRDIQIQLANKLGLSGIPMAFETVHRTVPQSSFRLGFQEYRILLELAPSLIVTDVAYPWDAVLAASGIPFLALNEQFTPEQLEQTKKMLLENETWTWPYFTNNFFPEDLASAETITILGDGCYRTQEDSGVVVCLNFMQMLARLQPDYFINEEYILRVPVFQTGSTVLANRWCDTLDVNAMNLPFRIHCEELELWNKCIERRFLSRGHHNLRGKWLLWSPYTQLLDEGRVVGGLAIATMLAIRQINKNAKLIYKWRSDLFEITPHEILEHMVIEQRCQPCEIKKTAPEFVELEPIHIKIEAYDLDLTHAGAYLGNWLMAHRGFEHDKTLISAHETIKPFISAQGYDTPIETPSCRTITLAPDKLYPL